MSVLVLNATYEPLCVVPTRRAAVLVITEKAEPVTDGDGQIRSERVCLNTPSIVRLRHYVKVPRRRPIALTRRAVFARDRHRCAYCSRPATTIDHVVPRSRGGRHVWGNVVAACTRCNHKKADKTLDELGWSLSHTPAPPGGPIWHILGHRKPHPAWLMWLGHVF